MLQTYVNLKKKNKSQLSTKDFHKFFFTIVLSVIQLLILIKIVIQLLILIKIVAMMRVCKSDMCLPKKKKKSKSDMPLILS